MAINYTNLFTLIGKCIQAANYNKSVFATMKTNSNELFQVTADQNLDYLGDGVAGALSSQISGISAGCAYYQNKVSEILLDPTLVTDNLAITSVSLATVLPALYKDMVTNSQSVLESPTIVGSTSIVGTGNGTLQTTNFLDDISNPVSNPTASSMNYYTASEFNSVPSNLGIVDTVFARCTNGDVEGQETFTIFGTKAVGAFEENTESLGGSISVGTMLQNNLLSNGDFETYSSGFTGWTITDGGGTTVQETSLMYRGASALRINTLVNADDVVLEQTLAAPLTRGKGYFIGLRLRSVAAEASGNITFVAKLYDGATLLAESEGGVTLSLTTTSWQTTKGFVVMPQNVDPDVLPKVQITMSPSVDGVDGVIIDDVYIVPVDYFNGVGIVVQNGSTRFRIGDLLQFAVTRPDPGVIQEFFRKTYGVQLPNASSTNETISDSLAT